MKIEAVASKLNRVMTLKAGPSRQGYLYSEAVGDIVRVYLNHDSVAYLTQDDAMRFIAWLENDGNPVPLLPSHAGIFWS